MVGYHHCIQFFVATVLILASLLTQPRQHITHYHLSCGHQSFPFKHMHAQYRYIYRARLATYPTPRCQSIRTLFPNYITSLIIFNVIGFRIRLYHCLSCGSSIDIKDPFELSNLIYYYSLVHLTGKKKKKK